MVSLATTGDLPPFPAAAPGTVVGVVAGATAGPAARGGAAGAAAAPDAPAAVVSGFGVVFVSTRITERTVSLAVRLPVASSSVIVLARIDVAPCHSCASP